MILTGSEDLRVRRMIDSIEVADTVTVVWEIA